MSQPLDQKDMMLLDQVYRTCLAIDRRYHPTHASTTRLKIVSALVQILRDSGMPQEVIDLQLRAWDT